jgi:hypothetical protein
MARTFNVAFNPFSYEEINQPLMAATLAQQQLEEQYANLADEALDLERLRGSAVDAGIYKRYREYDNKLNEAVQALAKNGLNVNSRSDMYGLRKLFKQEINPIKQAMAERTRQSQLQQQAYLADPKKMFARDASKVGLQEFMNNPDLDTLTQNYSGELLLKDVAAAASALKQSFARATPGSYIDDLTYQVLMKQGFDANDVAEFIRNYDAGNITGRTDSKNDQIYRTIVDNVIQSSGMRNWENWESLRDRAYGYALPGLYQGVGAEAIQLQKDDAKAMALQHQYDLAKIDYEYKKKKEAEQEELDKALDAPWNPFTLYAEGLGTAAGKLLEGKYAREVSEALMMQDIGVLKEGDTIVKLYTGKGKVETKEYSVADNKSGTVTTGYRKHFSKVPSVWNSKNNLLTREEYLEKAAKALGMANAQAARKSNETSVAMHEAEEAYDKAYKTLKDTGAKKMDRVTFRTTYKDLKKSDGTGYTQNDLDKLYDANWAGAYNGTTVGLALGKTARTAKASPSQTISAQPIDLGESDTNRLAEFFLGQQNSQGGLNIEEIKGADSSGKLQYTGKRFKRDEIFKKDTNGKVSLLNNARIYLPMSDDGLIIETNGRKFHISPDKMGVTVNTEMTKLRSEIYEGEKFLLSMPEYWRNSEDGKEYQRDLQAAYRNYYNSILKAVGQKTTVKDYKIE